jgi:hypothetical protein
MVPHDSGHPSSLLPIEASAVSIVRKRTHECVYAAVSIDRQRTHECVYAAVSIVRQRTHECVYAFWVCLLVMCCE